MWRVTILLVGLACVVPFLYHHLMQPHWNEACLQEHYTRLPFTQLREKLKNNLVGQSVAIEIIMENLSVFSGSKSSRPLVLWFSGREGCGKTLTCNLMRSVLGKACRVQAVFPSRLHGVERLRQEAATLLHGVDPCGPNFVIIDDWDDASSSALVILHLFLVGLQEDEKRRSSNVLVVLSGTRAGQEVWEYFLDLRQGEGGERRRHHDFTNLSITLQKEYLLSKVTSTAVLVPFLPLDATQVKRCVTRELMMMDKWEAVMDEEALTRMQQQVLARTHLYPGTNLAQHGCKRVSSLLTKLLPHLHEDL